MDTRDENLMRGVHASFFIEIGTNAPYAMSEVSFRKIGFADFKVAEVTIISTADTGSVTMLARQAVYRELESCGISNQAVEFTPTVQVSSKRQKFVDTNSRSVTLGQGKMGHSMIFHFEINKVYSHCFEFCGSRGKIRNAGITS
jgi:hypothetical protein